MTAALCERCGQCPRKPHHNARLCAACATRGRAHPTPQIEPWQAARIRAWVPRQPPMRELAVELGLSTTTISRYRLQSGISQRPRVYDDATAAEVVAYYERHGRVATAEAFPGVNVRSIVEGRPHALRRRPWRDDELIQLARMGGIVPADVQAAMFARPGAGPASIHAGWVKRFGHMGGTIHGLKPSVAARLLRPGFPILDLPAWIRRRGPGPARHHRRRLVLWADMPPWVRDDTPAFVAEGVQALAQFQRWLFAPEAPGAAIRSMLQTCMGKAS